MQQPIISDNGLAALHGRIPPREVGRLVRAIRGALAESVKRFPLRESMTQAELKDRVRFMVNFATEMFNDHGWNMQKVVDFVWTALEAKLSSRVWVPDDRAFYPVPETPGLPQ